MTTKFGFGIEKETNFLGYNDNLKDFTHQARGSTGQWTHNEGSGALRLGDYAYSTTDITVFNSNDSGRGGYELVTRKGVVRKKPKDTIIGFIKDTEKKARSDVVGNVKYKRTIPFGSVPGVKSSRYGGKVPGSYHVNMTMPFDDDMTNTQLSAYKEKMKKGILNIRAIQPLLFALTGGTTEDSVGNPNHLESSQRQIYTSGTSGIGYAKLKEGDAVFEGIDNHNDSGRGSSPNTQTWRNKLRQKFPEVGSASYADFRSKDYERNVPSIELRMLDTFDTRGLYGVFAVIASAMANGDNVEKFKDPATDAKWNDAMESIAKEGWNSYVDSDYVKYLNKNLKLDIEVPEKKIRADILMEKVTKKLWDKNKDDKWVKTWIPDRLPPKIHNFNKDSWEFYFIQKLKSDSTLRSKFDRLLLTIEKLDTSASSGKIRVQWKPKGKGYGVRDIILDDNVMGFDFGAEDTEDILHLMHRYGLIHTYMDSSGQIISIKKAWNSKEEMNKLVDKMLNEKHMLNMEEGGLLEVDLGRVAPVTAETAVPTIREPEPEPTVSPPIRREIRQEEGSITEGGVNINMPPSFEVDEDAGYNREDMQDVFNLADLKYQGRRVYVTVKYADIKKGTNNLPAYWKRTSPSRVILYLNKQFATEQTLSRWVDFLKVGMFSTVSTTQVSIFVDNMTNEEFFNKLRGIAREEYSKFGFRRRTEHSEKITLSRAGITRLNQKGIHIGSINNGQNYMLVTRKRMPQIMNRFRQRPRLLKNIPYYKNYYVEIKGNSITLKKGNMVIDKMEVK